MSDEPLSIIVENIPEPVLEDPSPSSVAVSLATVEFVPDSVVDGESPHATTTEPVVDPDIPSTWGWRTLLRLTIDLAAFAAVGWIIWRSRDALTPFIIGLVLAYLMVPLVDRLERHVPRWAAILIVYLLTFGVLGLALAYIIPPALLQINQLINSIPAWYEWSRAWAEWLIAQFEAQAPLSVRQQAQEQLAQIQQTAQQNATAYAQRVGAFLFDSVLRIFQTLTFLLGFLIIPFFLFYVLLDSKRLPRAVNRVVHPRVRADFWNILRIVDTIFGKYIRGQLTLGLVVGLMSFVGLMGLNLAGFNVPFTVLLAIVAGIGEMIPVVGPILSAIPAIIVGFSDSVRTGLAVAVLYIVIQQVENQVLVPRIVGNTLRLHAALLMALLVISSQLGGLLLVILSAPLVAIARDVFVYSHRRLQEPPVAPEAAILQVLDDKRTSDA